jgi:hypothetical protein
MLLGCLEQLDDIKCGKILNDGIDEILWNEIERKALQHDV